jgi:exopolyphosphatase / guanosine-5'-triphosphate,3'-diphosphate pyrophosphatase
MTQENRASIDIGSNSVLLLIGEMRNGKFYPHLKRSEVTGLGRELDKNKGFNSESMQETYDVMKSYAEDCDKFGIPRSAIIATATEAARVALNSSEFFSSIQRDLGITVTVITSEAEAYFSAKGILFDSVFTSEIITIMDIGGASTELIKVNTKTFQVLDSISMPVGAVRCSQWLDDQLFVQNLQKVFLDFRGELDKFQSKELFCVAGTVTSLGNMHLKHQEFHEEEVHGLILKAEEVDSLFKKYSDLTPDKYQEAFPFLQKRSRSIRGGLHLTYHMIHRLLVKDITISTYGLRYGTILEGQIKKDFIYGKS